MKFPIIFLYWQRYIHAFLESESIFLNIFSMIDIKILRTNPGLIRDSITKRNLKIDLDTIIQVDASRVRQQQELDLLRARRNELSSQMGK